MSQHFDKRPPGLRMLWLVAMALLASAAEAVQPAPAFRDEAVIAQVVKVDQALAVDVSAATATSDVVRVLLGPAVTSVKSVQRAGGKLIVMGDLGAGGATEVSFIDLQTRQLHDRFWAIQPAASPDGSLIAFVRFYPLRGVGGVDSQYRLYRLAASPAQNRAAFADVAPGDVGPSDLQDVGASLYPSFGGKAVPDNIEVSERLAHRHGSGLFWSPDSRAVAFVDSYRGKSRVVLVSLGADARVVSIRSAALPASSGGLCVSASGAKGCRVVAIEAVQITLEGTAVAVRMASGDEVADRQARRLDLPLTSFVVTE